MKPRVPLLPLIRAVEREGRSPPEIREVLHLSGHRWKHRSEATVSIWMADRLAVKAGLHPIEIWGDVWLYPEETETPTNGELS